MVSEKFLGQVAEYFVNKGVDLSQYTFVFPNKRSALFMRKYLQQTLADVAFMPRMISITYFTQLFCPASALADNTELVFILYKVYCRILHRHGKDDQIPDFDNFYFWGAILLNDFNDVDSYMVDTSQIFRNLKGVKEISANYLTPEQLEVARLLWGNSALNYNSEVFWNHIPSDSADGTPSDKFLALWEIMGELYNEFVAELDAKQTPLTYSGLQSRRACERISAMGLEDFAGKRFAFIGFNVLPTSRILIFKRLAQLGIAEFFWDIASPIFNDDISTPNNTSKYVRSLARRFKMPDDFDLIPISNFPEIEIIAVPSNVGQVKVTADILQEWADSWAQSNPSKSVSPSDLIETAVVLADESILVPLLHSIPASIDTVNVTMGLPYRSTPFAALMSSIISMHLRAFISRQVYHYFYQDVVEVLSHPHFSVIAPVEAAEIKDTIKSEHLFNVSTEFLHDKYPQLDFIFSPISDQEDIDSVKKYISNLVKGLSQRLARNIPQGNDVNFYEIRLLEGYDKAIEYLCSLVKKYNVKMHERTFLQMIERTLSTEKINFTGEPLKGLQILNIMQTRALDFDNIILLSANERTFPKRNYNPSLIPASLRRGYMLPTQEHEEASYAYQFYRMISRAKRVKLIYDNRTGGLTSGEMSRYLSQLVHLDRDINIKISNLEFTAEVDDPKPIIIHKTPEVINELRGFRPGGKRRLSASALKSYISCPLKFYLQYVKGIRVNDQVMEYIDAASYGSIIHSIFETLYTPYAGQRINEYTLDKILATDIEHLALVTLNEKYYKCRYTDRLNDMPGEGKVTAKIITKYVTKLLQWEKTQDPFIFVGAEVGEHEMFEWKINDKYTINFTMSIDRIDCTKPSENPDECALRFIDYKTGSDDTRATLNNLFTDTSKSGIFQLLIYCHAYSDINNFKGKITPLIYKLQEISKGVSPVIVDKNIIDDYRTVDSAFFPRFEELIDKIFEEDDQYPFVQTSKLQHCLYCPFSTMCQRVVEER